jgi:hypothetical protein
MIVVLIIIGSNKHAVAGQTESLYTSKSPVGTHSLRIWNNNNNNNNTR